MNLLIVAALVAVCSAAKLDRTYLPPASAKTAGGSPGALQTPNSFTQNSAPKGSYTNDFQGVVVDAALAGTRASGSEETGLGAPRKSYGFTASKVGDAAFRGAQGGFRFPVSTQDNFGSSNSQFGVSHDSVDQAQFGEAREIPERSQGFGGDQDFIARDSRPERPQAAQERAASTLRFDSEVGAESFNYAFETDNGISAEETGVATNGVQAQGGYSYTGDDGKVYSVTYTADEGGYQPRGDHLPTPPPIPEEILKSLEQNARDEANGVIDDGLYDAQKYNAGSDYAESDSTNGKQNGRPSVNSGNTDVDASSSFINQNNSPFNPNNPRQRGDDKRVNQFQASSGNGGFQSNAASGNRFGSRNEYLPPFQQGRPQNSRPQFEANAESSDADSSSTFQQESTEQGSGDFHSHSQNQHPHSEQHNTRPSSQSFGSKPSSNNQFNSFKQSSSNGNQFNQNGNRFPSSQGNRQQFAAAPVNIASHNGHNQFSAQASSSLSSQQSTSIPDTELTTPFESSPQAAQPSAPTSANTFGFNAQPSRNGQSQFGSHGSLHQASQAPAQPTIPSFPQSRPQSSNNRPFVGNRNTQPAFSSQAPQAPQQQEQFSQQPQFGNNKRPQFSQNQFSQNADNQFAPSTQRPQFAQQATAQDDSYYYNQPSRAFNTPQTQGSRFPSAPSHQFDRVTQRPSFSSQTTQYPEEQNYPSTPFPSQNGQRQGSTRYPRPPSFPTESTPSDNQFQGNAIASATSGITQASASAFAAPTSATGFNRQQFGQSKQQSQQSSFQSNRPASPEPSKPSSGAQTTAQPASSGQSEFEKQNFESAQPLSQQPLQDVKQPKLDDDTKPDVPVTNQQYNGEIYEYTKPAEMLPPPENGFGQFGQKVQSTQQPAQSRPQFGQTPTASMPQATSGPFASKATQFGQNAKAPQRNQFESQPQLSQASSQTQQSDTVSSFASKPQFGQNGKAPQRDQFGAQTASQEQSADDQFDAKPSRQQFSQSAQAHSVQSSNQFANQHRPFAQSQGSFAGSAETPMPFGQNGRSCCKSQFGQQPSSAQRRPSQFGESSFGANAFQSNSAFNPGQSQSVAGKGEVFGGPRVPPSFDETGYHY